MHDVEKWSNVLYVWKGLHYVWKGKTGFSIIMEDDFII